MRILPFLIVLVLALGAEARVYRWVDATGEVHFGDHPPPVVEAEPVRLPPPPKTDPGAAMKAIENERRQAVDEYLKKRDEAARKKDAAAAREAKRQANCATARDNLRKLEGLGNRLVRMPDGSYVRLTEEERQARMAEARKQIGEFCKAPR